MIKMKKSSYEVPLLLHSFAVRSAKKNKVSVSKIVSKALYDMFEKDANFMKEVKELEAGREDECESE